MSELKPGRELDALIAEHVMGWTWNKECNCWNYPSGCPTGFAFNPSTEIAEAWEILAALASKKFEIDINHDTECLELFDEKPYWYVRIYDRYGHTKTNGDGSATSDSLPHAICLAALKAVGYEVKE